MLSEVRANNHHASSNPTKLDKSAASMCELFEPRGLVWLHVRFPTANTVDWFRGDRRHSRLYCYDEWHVGYRYGHS